jgi:hypothetical protein
LGEKIKKGGNHVYGIGKYEYKNININNINNTSIILSFPTKHDWRDKSDLKLIEQSCIELRNLWDIAVDKDKKYNSVALTRVGCLNGGLNYEFQVKPLLLKYFGDDKYRPYFMIYN